MDPLKPKESHIQPTEASSALEHKTVKLSRKDRHALMKQYRRGIVSQEDLRRCGIDGKGFDFLYSQFRLGGLSRIESWYNACFIYVLHRFDQSEKQVSHELQNTYSHPKGWYRDSFYTWRNNFWSHLLGILQRIPTAWLKVKEYFRDLPANLKKSHHRRTVRMDNSFRLFVNACRGLRRTGKILIPLICAVPLIYCVHQQLNSTIALEVYVNGAYVGAVENGDVLIQAKKMLERNLSSALGDSFHFTDDITYHFTHQRNLSYLNESDVYSALYAAAKQHIRPGYGLYVDNALIVASENKAALEKAVEDIKEYYKTRTAFYAQGEDIRVSYANDITILSRDFPVELLEDETQLRKTLGLQPLESNRPNPKDAIYSLYYKTIKEPAHDRLSGEAVSLSLTGTAMANNVLEETDVLASSERSGAGQPVDVTLDYVITRQMTVEEEIPYETQYVESEEYLQGTQRVSSEGRDGFRKAVYDVSFQNGKEISRELVSEDVLKPVQNRVIYIGTRIPTAEELATMATGTFIMPYDNYLSSGYGLRTISDLGTKDFHPAWDIPGPYGSKILASDGGVVTSVSYTSGYGLHVILDHENGYETVYAHLSKSAVKVGDRVGQGDVIAYMGSSGRVTGVHVHFEIRKNGVSVDPKDFLGEVEERY